MISKKTGKKLSSYFFILVLFYACANIGQGPQGGPYDFDPPILQHSTPKNNETNVKSNKIVLTFDENINLNSISQKLIVTPPQKRLPIVTAANKKVYVELRDSLQDNTTYVVDFSDAIEDFNQNNPIENFSISFSTGETIDTLQVSGKVLMASDNEPVKGYYVGLHTNLSDTAFTDIPFPHISRTNDRGEFTLKGLKDVEYKIYALEDNGRDYRYTSLDQYIAFSDIIIKPTVRKAHINDTIFKQDGSNEVDSIRGMDVTLFVPNDLLLKAFKSSEERQYFINANRSDAHRFELNFGGLTAKPLLRPLNFTDGNWAIEERNTYQDSIFMYWITDNNLISQDTLQFEMSYMKTDSLFQLQLVQDTILVVDRNRKFNDKKKKKEEEDQIVFLDFKNNVKSVFDVYDTIKLEFGEPLKTDLTEVVYLESKVDSTYSLLDYTLYQDSLNPRKYSIYHKWDYDSSYRVRFDSAAVFSVYDFYANKWTQDFKTRALEDYANLQLNISGLTDEYPLFVQLLDEKGIPVRQQKVKNMRVIFRTLLPKKYYARLVVDRNGNNRWDSGDYFTNTQPEQVYYYPKPIELRAFWDTTESFNINPMIFEKPIDLLKNKPIEKTEREKLMEKEDSERFQREKEQQRQRDIATGNVVSTY